MNKDKVVLAVFTMLLSIIGWMAIEGLKNNTRAMDRLTISLDRIDKRLDTHEADIRGNKVKIDSNDKRLDRAGY